MSRELCPIPHTHIHKLMRQGHFSTLQNINLSVTMSFLIPDIMYTCFHDQCLEVLVTAVEIACVMSCIIAITIPGIRVGFLQTYKSVRSKFIKLLQKHILTNST